MSAIFRLHPHLQHAIVHDLGWRELRQVQELAIEAVLDGDNAVVLAPTAGGKTEASLFPVLSEILSHEAQPVAALYICPIRALLNNLEQRIQAYARMVGLEAFKWHGDVSASRKGRFRAEPAHLLMTTPESLEVMLISAKTDASRLFAGLQTVIIDEVHAFAGDDRGAHLVSIIERLVRFCGRDLQRIGLSATVGNPEQIGRWLQGSSRRSFRLVDPPKAPAARDLRVEHCQDLLHAANGMAQAAQGKKSLVFVESRAQAEKAAQALAGRGVEVFVHHSSVSRADRQLAEEQFTRGQNTAIVCTSTMELGIDVGDLDHILQVDAPATVASFLQRMGRTGRRAGARANCSFFCLSSESMLQAIAQLRLAHRGWVEDVKPWQRATHVLAHQVLALGLQEGGISRHRVLPWLAEASPYAGLEQQEVQQLIDTMVQRDILYEADGLLTLGKRGEELYGRQNFFELYAVFTAPPVLKVLNGRSEVGFVQAGFVQGHDPNEGPLMFRLAGRPWQVTRVEWGRGLVSVRPAERGKVPSWLGLPTMLSFDVCQEMRRTLCTPGPEAPWLSPAAQAELTSLRDGYEGLLEQSRAPLEILPDQVRWHTFAGGAINRMLAAGLNSLTAGGWVAGNISVKHPTLGAVAAHQAMAELTSLDWTILAAETAHGMIRGRLSKFQPCLPSDAEDRLLVDKLLDVSGTVRFLDEM